MLLLQKLINLKTFHITIPIFDVDWVEQRLLHYQVSRVTRCDRQQVLATPNTHLDNSAISSFVISRRSWWKRRKVLCGKMMLRKVLTRLQDEQPVFT